MTSSEHSMKSMNCTCTCSSFGIQGSGWGVGSRILGLRFWALGFVFFFVFFGFGFYVCVLDFIDELTTKGVGTELPTILSQPSRLSALH